MSGRLASESGNFSRNLATYVMIDLSSGLSMSTSAHSAMCAAQCPPHYAWGEVMSHYNLYVGGNIAYCVKLNGEDLSHYSSKSESVDLRERLHCIISHYLTKK